MSKSISDFLAAEGSVEGCPVCGKARTVQILVQLRSKGGAGKTISRTVNVCDDHAMDLWDLCTTEVEHTRNPPKKPHDCHRCGGTGTVSPEPVSTR